VFDEYPQEFFCGSHQSLVTCSKCPPTSGEKKSPGRESLSSVLDIGIAWVRRIFGRKEGLRNDKDRKESFDEQEKGNPIPAHFRKKVFTPTRLGASLMAISCWQKKTGFPI